MQTLDFTTGVLIPIEVGREVLGVLALLLLVGDEVVSLDHPGGPSGRDDVCVVMVRPASPDPTLG